MSKFPGKRIEVPGEVPAVEENTTWFDVDLVRIGVEYRILTEAVVKAHFKTGTPERAVVDALGPIGDDRGVAIHVLEKATGTEYLKFDCFEVEPHYHYVKPGTCTYQVDYDPFVNGNDMVNWALDCIENRLPELLDACGAHDLAMKLDRKAFSQARTPVAEAAARADSTAGKVASGIS
jgi:hypothetical protein